MSKRPLCPHCEFILARCLCHSLKPIGNQTQIIILQHNSETKHALNTVALMKKSYQNIKVFIGEDFTHHDELNSIIDNNKDNLMLVFPTLKSELLTSVHQKKITHIILLDGTWKKTQKIFILSKNLHLLPSIKLEIESASLYKIRKGPKALEHSLSTLEASLSVLNILEKDLETTSLKDSFLAMIDFQIEKMGAETFKKNYKSDE